MQIIIVALLALLITAALGSRCEKKDAAPAYTDSSASAKISNQVADPSSMQPDQWNDPVRDYANK